MSCEGWACHTTETDLIYQFSWKSASIHLQKILLFKKLESWCLTQWICWKISTLFLFWQRKKKLVFGWICHMDWRFYEIRVILILFADEADILSVTSVFVDMISMWTLTCLYSRTTACQLQSQLSYKIDLKKNP